MRNSGSGLSAKLTGAPVMQLEIRNAVERDRLIYNGLGFVRRLRRRLSLPPAILTLIAVLGPTIAILWTLGMLGGLDFRLNLFINVITPLILVSGFSIRCISCSPSAVTSWPALDRIEAARNRCPARLRPACPLTAMNQAISIVSFAFAESALIRTFGLAALLAVVHLLHCRRGGRADARRHFRAP